MFIPDFVKEREKNNIPFDLYFAGTSKSSTLDYLRDKNLPILYSQFYQKSLIKDIINSNYTGKLFIDSGAHTAHTHNLEINPDDYISYINSVSDKVCVFAQLDKIPGIYLQPKTAEDWKNAPKQSWENYLYMRERVIEPEKLMPIHHQGESFSWLQNMLNYVDSQGKHIPYIGLSPRGDVPVKSKIDYLTKCFNIIENSNNPNVKTHALGMTSLKVLEMFPLYSADSTTFVRAASFGEIISPWGRLIISKDRDKKSSNNYFTLCEGSLVKVNAFIRSLGFTPEELIENAHKRLEFNAKYLEQWSKNYRYKPVCSKIKTTLF